MKLSFSLAHKAAKPLPPPKPLASLGEDDETLDTATTDNKEAAANKKLLALNVGSSQAAQKHMQKELMADPTVYQYDEVWDRMQDVKQRQKEAKEAEARLRKVSAQVLCHECPLSSSSPNT